MEKNSLMRVYRLMHKLYRKRVPVLPGLLMRYIRVIYSCELPPQTVIGEGSLFVHNGLGCVINPSAIIGNNVKIYQNVTIGGRNNRGTPMIEDDVFIGPGACILGVVHIKKGATIGANAVCVNDVEAFSTVVGIPARSLPKSDEAIC